MAIHISVVVPTYKRPSLLKSCLDALNRQTLRKTDFEIIVVSDGPDEATANVVAQLQQESALIRYFALPQKKGPAAARNLGWKEAKASIIAFTDDDCLPDSNWLNAGLSEFQTLSDMVFTGKVIVPRSEKPTDHEMNTANLEKAEFITANCFCRKAALEHANGFDERFGLAWREDSDLQFKFMELRIAVKKNEHAVVIHPVRPVPWGFSMKEQKKGLYNALLYKKYPGLYRSKIQHSPAWNYYVMTGCLILGIVALILGAEYLSLAAILIWLVLLTQFIIKRLRGTAHSREHVLEMIITSMVIPFLSIYWQLYGAIKYRVWFF